MTYFNPDVYKKESIEDKEKRAFIDGMEAVYEVADAFIDHEFYDIDSQTTLKGMPTLFRIQKEILTECMYEFKKFLSTEIMQNVVGIIERETVSEEDE